MSFDLHTPPSRHGTGSLKWQKYQDRDVLPMWVADMDFPSAPEILDALHERVDHGVFGYTVPSEEAVQAVKDYMASRHGQKIEADWLVWLPGLVQGLNIFCRSRGQEGDAVMVNIPVYPPFLSAPIFSGKQRLTSPLVEVDGRFTFDREGMEASVTPETRLLILCNPHNPVGRVFDREELSWLLDFCERHDLWICSDEIHCDLLLRDEVEHVPFLSLGDRARERSVTFLSPSKTYNLPGLACAYAVIPNPELRKAFQHACRGLITEVNCFGFTGLKAAYTHGEAWRQDMLRVLRQNLERLEAFLAEQDPKIPMPRMEATYLAWLDLRAYGFNSPVRHLELHGIGLSNGQDFGAPAGFVRLNFGCPPNVLEQGLKRLQTALQSPEKE